MIILDNLVIGHNKSKIVGPIVNGHIKQGSMVAVIGPNGIGKSTLLKILAGLLVPIAGKLQFVKSSRLDISYLPQKTELNYRCPLTVFDVVSMGCWPRISLFMKLNYYQYIIIWNALKKVKLFNLRYQYIEDLSGGQFQRMLLARTLVQQSSLILLDEPFQGVDINICHMMMHAISQLCRNGCTMIMALHDNNLISEYFSNVLVLNNLYSFWKSL